ncbi:MAG: nucleotidyl transferase AbiEii/AbiGii toxin family protein, partial [Spirochaetota bacterium]
MNLHTYKDDFPVLINRTSAFFNIPEFFIEKDYWVTFVLRNLSLSKYASQVVFKGGTSLSKAYNCIDRFSEDIDLALKEPELGDSKRKTLMKQIEDSVTLGLTCVEDYPGIEKRGRNRKTFYGYPHIHDALSFSPVKDVIQLEIN